MPFLPPRALILAPMVELSHAALRDLIVSFGGCDRYSTEMSGAAAYVAGAPWDRWFLDTTPEPGLTSVQFFAPDAPTLAQAIAKLRRELAAAGLPFGGVDLNFGCAAPQIEKAGGGVSWMKDPEGAAALVATARSLLPDEPLSCKLRLGYEESAPGLVSFCRGLADAGADWLTLHPRLRHEKFRRTGKWAYVGLLSGELDIPVIGNGDVRDLASFRAAVDGQGAGGVMIGREAVRRPWIFALLRGQDGDPAFSMIVDVLQTGMDFLDLLKRRLPPEFHLSRARRFFFYYCDNLSFGHHLRFAIQNAPDLDTIERLFLSYFEQVPAERVQKQA